jgi:imidazolonepropionase-like amidohydrolase
MWACAHPACTVWGTGNGTLENCGVYPNNADEARAYVRECVDMGVDYIKIIISGGNPYYDLPDSTPCITDDIVEAIIDESHKQGKRAICHVETLEKATMAAERGADELHHLVYTGTQASSLEEYEPLFRRMCRDNIWLCPTLILLYRFEARMIRKGLKGDNLNCLKRGIEVFRSAYEYGVPITCGTDSGAILAPWGPSLHAEMHSYVDDLGMSPLEAIRSATGNAAVSCGLDDILGTIKAEALADLIVLDKDPSVDIHNSTSIRMVLREGKIVFGDGATLTDEDMPSNREFNFWAKEHVYHVI